MTKAKMHFAQFCIRHWYYKFNLDFHYYANYYT